MLPKKKVRSTQTQLRTLVDYMSVHQSFANGEYTGPMGNTQHLTQWDELRVLLKNDGPDKTVEQWRHTWRDLKKKAREDGAKFKKATAQTGNHLSVPGLSEMSNKILGIIGTEMAYGLENSQESGIGNFMVQLPPPPPISPIRTSSLPIIPPPTSHTFSVTSRLSRSTIPFTSTPQGDNWEIPIAPPPPSPTSTITSILPTTPPSTKTPLQWRSISLGDKLEIPIIPSTTRPTSTITSNLPTVLPPPSPTTIRTTSLPTVPSTTSTITSSLPSILLSPSSTPTRTTSLPTVPPSTSAPQQGRMGLGHRAAEFLNAEREHTNVLRDVLNTLNQQNEILRERNRILVIQQRLKNRERLRQARRK